ncbi:tRNA pseudouridine(55) synthase TruB [Clostridium algidicarnis]|uniref:tRNA pseudouridine synthase B n=2 Tax=Clostridium algidicarnis TaxID=37659 RepID=A0A2S6FY42_9CLOT|nr:tRNA pseudouridine(55) synthase TruB [Clostridium algidicarnis]MBB6630191.1 tRNA pseudouridine(55) synthase TruB [Clostridium algidicarnis]MBB6697501.1 tRNA pseudouridine(55) synthase TruB [Clostridium algidicarnis]MBU3192988.1 tRNA pseudouridine(55) synthase TruB [Clostridium algidicarnis]MBU3203410.1 tRNA pseudouridine(55) synthase TruB [Clostridium algidicarnis]MBU3206267.1 tRNA pseudouridine(55) synthase TruB [Clostridium algidicarnis]
MNGVINIYKPEGMTSFDAVRKVRHISKEKKVGHIGTLDPLAKGVLPICVGKATKIVEYLMSESKVYNVELELGLETDTYDREGKITSKKSTEHIKEEDIRTVIESFIGESYQEPPMYSALKVNGKKLYDLAREGIEIEREKRKINIECIEIEEINIPFVTFKVVCSKGTYIRSLCKDIGSLLNCGAMMSKLERESTGNFVKSKSINVLELTEENIKEYLLPMEAVLDYPTIEVSDKFSSLLINGVSIKDPSLTKEALIENKLYKVYNNLIFIGIGSKFTSGFKIVKLLI